MKGKTRVILITVAAILLVLAMVGFAVLALLDRDGGDASDSGTEKTETHADTEYTYNEDGSVASEVYYKNNEYTGRKDYYTDKNTRTDYTMTFDADGNEIASEKTVHNTLGSMTFYQRRDNGDIVETVEYDYFDDMTTLKKKTSKSFAKDGTENAEKLYYYESGKISRRCEFINGETVLDESYDENGNKTDAPSAK